MAESLRIYRRLIGARIRGEFQYRTSFYLFLAAQFFITLLDFVAIAVIFNRTPALAGWSFREVAFLYGLSGIGFGIADLFVSPVETVGRRIKDGTFDRLLVRPLSSLAQIDCEEFALRRVGKTLQAVAVFAYATAAVDVDWTVAKVVVAATTVLSSTVIFSALFVLGASIQFWTIDGQEAANAFTYGGNYLTQYPLGIYGRWLRRVFAFIVPTAFVCYFPSLYILGRDDLLGAPSFVRFLAPAVAAAMAGVAAAGWRFAVGHYRSTGS